MFHLNDRHKSDSSFVPKMAVVHNLPSRWYSAWWSDFGYWFQKTAN